MKKRSTRILAWMLCLCMAISMLPAIPAQVAEAADPIVYDFSGAYTGIRLGNGSALTQDATWGSDDDNKRPYAWLKDGVNGDIMSAALGIGWEIADVAVSNQSGGVETFINNDYVALAQDYGVLINTYGSRWAEVGIVLTVPQSKAGWYTLNLNQLFLSIKPMGTETIQLFKGKSASGSKMAELVIDSTVSADVSKYNIQKYTSGRKLSNLKDVQLLTTATKFDAGEYYLKVKVNYKSGNDKNNTVAIKNITMVPAEAPDEPEEPDEPDEPSGPSVVNGKVTYDFVTGVYNSSWTQDTTHNNYPAVLLKDGANDGIMSAARAAGWYVADAKVTNGTFITNNGVFLVDTLGIAVSGYNSSKRDGEVGIVLTVPQGINGWYEVKLNQMFYTQSKLSAETVSLYQGTSAAGTKLAELKIDSSVEADVSKYNIKSNTSDRKPENFRDASIGTVKLEPGTYYLKVALDILSGSNQKTNTVFFRNVTLTPGEEPEVPVEPPVQENHKYNFRHYGIDSFTEYKESSDMLDLCLGYDHIELYDESKENGVGKFAADYMKFGTTDAYFGANDPWQIKSIYSNVHGEKTSWVKTLDGCGFMLMADGRGNVARFTATIRIPEGQDGWYSVNPRYAYYALKGEDGKQNNAALTVDADITFSITDKDGNKVINDYDAKQKKIHTWNTDSIGIGYFAAGDYELTYEVSDTKGTSAEFNATILSYVELVVEEEPNKYIIGTNPNGNNMEVGQIEENDTGTATIWITEYFKPFEGATFTATSSDTSIATASVTGKTLSVTGVKKGTAKITVNATVPGGEKVTPFEFDIEVIPEQYVYSFLGYGYDHEITANVTSYDMTANIASDPWCAGWQNNATMTFRVSSPTGYGAVLGSYVGPAAGIKVKVTKAALYTVSSAYQTGGHEGIMRMYVSPVDAENPIAPEYSVGHKDTYAASGLKTSTNFRTIYLEEGEYMVSWEIIGQNEAVSPYPRLFLTNAKFVKSEEYPTVTVDSVETPEDIKMGNVGYAKVTASASDGSVEDLVGAEFRIENAENRVARIEAVENEEFGTSLKITGLKVGYDEIPIDVYVRGVKHASFVLPVNIIEPAPLRKVEVSLRENDHNTLQLRELMEIKGNLDVVLTDEDGQEISDLSAELQNAVFNFTSSDPKVATVDENGEILAVSEGKAVIRCDVTIGEVTLGDEINLTVSTGKSRRSYYTDERVNAVQENIKNFTWAKDSANAVIKKADRYVDKTEYLYDKIPTQDLPRSYYVGYYNDPNILYCKHPLCGKNVLAETGVRYFYEIDLLNDPWKIQCPLCRRKFPTNDFGSFYDLGIVEASETELYEGIPAGQWSYEKSHYEHYLKFQAEYAAAGVTSYEEHKAIRDAGERLPAVGFLKNISEPELEDTWGVDDGYGYKTGKDIEIAGYTIPEVYSFIAYYHQWAIWNNDGEFCDIFDTLRDAYIYTGEAKYGRAGAILLARVADIYPHLYIKPYIFLMGPNQAWRHGKGVDRIWETHTSRDWARGYDAFFPMYEDERVISFLSERAAKYNLENPKSNAKEIREYIETNILRQMFEDAKTAHLNGNFGMTQAAIAMAAVALDSVPETIEMLDWVFQNGETSRADSRWYDSDTQTGGDVMRKIINNVSRDGTNDEIGPNYIKLWYAYLNMMLDYLAGYDKYPAADLYNNPRYVKMLECLMPFTMSRASTLSIADSGNLAKRYFYIDATTAASAFRYTGKPIFAQIIYFLNGNTTKGLHYDMYTPNPNSLASDVEKAIQEYGEYDFDKSRLLAGYGLAALRGGTRIESVSAPIDTQRTFWISFAKGYVNQKNAHSGHNHFDGLNLGIEAYGFNVAPDIGYPELTGTDRYRNWDKSTVAHNTVVVDAKHQDNTEANDPLHFDDSGMVKVMDIDASDTYAVTDKYRRTVVNVDIDEEISYGVDFFRVKGGKEHVYAFHAMSSLMPETGKIVDGEAQAINLIRQEKGTYQGENVEYATENSPNGFAWLFNVDRAADAGKNFFVDFEIQDYDNLLEKERNLHLKLTMLNSFDMTELAFADGVPPSKNGVDTLKFMLAKRTGTNLDTMFTTVIEPYDGESKIASMEALSVTDSNGAIVKSEGVKAVKVTLNSGRNDYIIYSDNDSVEYNVVDGDFVLPFKGFLGVYSVINGECVYAYLNDGTKLGEYEGNAAFNGIVTDFTKENSAQNYITVKFDGEFDINALAGEHIRIANIGRGNGVYEILGAEFIDEETKTVELDIGDISLIDTLATGDGGVYTYNYNIAENATFRIPRATVISTAPVISPVSDMNIAAGKKMSKQFTAYSPSDKDLTFEAVELPRGAIFDAEKATLTWTPDDKQMGIHAVGIRVSDGALNDVAYFNVVVARGAGNSAAGGAGGSGNSGSTDSGNSGSTDSGNSGATDSGNSGATDSGNTGTTDSPSTPSERFIDLEGHDWAKEAIYTLVEKGIVNGTSEKTYAPAANIKRADFAIMLTRAFKITQGEAEQFADVDSSKYYAEELRLAKAAGIVGGIGDNKFNPDGEITRQDMMVMLCRALKAQGYEIAEADASVLEQFADAADIADYAVEAVAALVDSGIVAGANGKLNLLAKATRAEIAAMLVRVIK